MCVRMNNVCGFVDKWRIVSVNQVNSPGVASKNKHFAPSITFKPPPLRACAERFRIDAVSVKNMQINP